MSKPKPPADLWEQMDRLRSASGFSADPVPHNALTVAEYAAKYDLPLGRAKYELYQMRAKGKLNQGKKMAPNNCGRACALVCYWPKE